MSKYTYSPLDPNKRQIRLIELHPGRYRQPLKGILKTVDLEDKPNYDALSYTWGPITGDKSISLSEKEILPISNNLERALQRLRRRFRKRVLWIDQICINQADVDERSAQVAFMGEIYSSSDSCVVWLGDVRDNSIARQPKLLRARFLISFLRWMLWRIYRDGWTMWSPIREDPFDDPVSEYLQSYFAFPSKRACCCLLWDVCLLRPYYMSLAIAETNPAWIDRAWVRQEYMLSYVPWIHFGRHRLAPFEARLNMLRMWIHDILEHDHLTCAGAPEWHRHCARFVDGINIVGQYRDSVKVRRIDYSDLLGIITFERTLSVTDARDRVYSLLNVMVGEEKDIIGSSYKISCAEAFSKATYATMVGRRRGFSAFAYVTFGQNITYLRNLPTWAIDFVNIPELTSIHMTFHHSRSMTSPLLRKTECKTETSANSPWTTLSLKAIHLGAVTANVSIEVQTDIERVSGQIVSDQGAKEYTSRIVKLMESNAHADDDLVERIYNTAAHFKSNVSGIPKSKSSIVPDQLQLHDLLASIFNEGSNIDEDREAELRRNLHQYLHYARQNTTAAKAFVTDQSVLGVALSLVEPGDRVVLPIFNCEHNQGSEVGIHKFWHQPALVLRSRGSQWTFRGVAYCHGLEKMDLDMTQAETFSLV